MNNIIQEKHWKDNSKAILIKQYDKALGFKQPKKPLWLKLKPYLTLRNRLNQGFSSKIKDKLSTLQRFTSLMNKIPLSVLFIIILLSLSLTVLVANKLRMQHFVNVVQGSYPELTQVPLSQEGKPIGQSAIDRILAEFNAINAVGYFVLWAITFRQFLRSIWLNHNPRKPQILGRV